MESLPKEGPRARVTTRWFLTLGVIAMVVLPLRAAQDKLHSAGMDHADRASLDLAHWFGMLELPFLFITIFFAFRTARALKGGVFGRGMALMAWGFLVMAVGHLHMQAKHFFGFDLFATGFGHEGGLVIWFLALVTTWLLSLLGFYNIYKASSAG